MARATVKVVRRPDNRAIAEWAREVATEALTGAGLRVRDAARESLNRQKRVDSGDLQSSITEPRRVAGEDVAFDVIAERDHGIYVEYGRGPGKQPPPEVLRAWVKRRLGLDGAEANSAAYAIGRAIAKRGIVGAYFLREGAESIDVDQLARAIEEELNG
jgi:hypothetical protein